jgi:hypothetical protein
MMHTRRRRRFSFGSRKCCKLIRCVYVAVIVAWEVFVNNHAVLFCCLIQLMVRILRTYVVFFATNLL